jgi:hypothetical protein
MVLKKNNFTFNGDHYLQINCTAMGTKMAPSYANIFMGKLEKQLLESTCVIGFVDFGKKIESARFGTVWY